MQKNKISISTFLSQETIERKIYFIRGKKVMLDSELASLYGVLTKNLNKAVLRNLDRFPEDFMFQLSKEDAKELRFQFGTLPKGHFRYLPHVFTEHGVLMLSSVLNSPQAAHVNIQIMRAFLKQREMINANKDLKIRVAELEKKYDTQFQVVFKAIKALIDDKPFGGDQGKKRFDL